MENYIGKFDKLILVSESKEDMHFDIDVNNLLNSKDNILLFKAFIWNSGVGRLYKTQGGAYVVFSQFPISKIPDYEKKHFIFLAGPTPEEYCGRISIKLNENITKARYWRRVIIDYLTENKDIGEDYVFVLPEPYSTATGSWTICKYSGMENISGLRQLTWEHLMIELASKTGSIGFFAWFRWRLGDNIGNIGPTTRFEAGESLGKHSKKSFFWIPSGSHVVPHSENNDWIKAHIILDKFPENNDIDKIKNICNGNIKNIYNTMKIFTDENSKINFNLMEDPFSEKSIIKFVHNLIEISQR